MSFASVELKKKTCRSSYPNSGHHSCRKLRVASFFILEIYSQPRTSKNHVNNLFKPILNSKSAKNRSQTQNQPKNQFLLYLRSNFFRHFKSKKHLSQTSIVICNHLKQNSNILVVGIKEMAFFFF